MHVLPIEGLRAFYPKNYLPIQTFCLLCFIIFFFFYAFLLRHTTEMCNTFMFILLLYYCVWTPCVVCGWRVGDLIFPISFGVLFEYLFLFSSTFCHPSIFYDYFMCNETKEMCVGVATNMTLSGKIFIRTYLPKRKENQTPNQYCTLNFFCEIKQIRYVGVPSIHWFVFIQW